MKAAHRLPLLLALLAGCAAVVAWDRLRARPVVAISGAVERPRAAAAPAAREAARAPAEVAAQAVASLRPREGWDAAGADAFQVPARPAPPVARTMAPPAPTEPARPVAPAVPFTVLGKKLDRGAWEVYLAKGEQVFVAREGGLVTEDYRVEAIGPSEIRLTYLPLNERQSLQTGASFHD